MDGARDTAPAWQQGVWQLRPHLNDPQSSRADALHNACRRSRPTTWGLATPAAGLAEAGEQSTPGCSEGRPAAPFPMGPEAQGRGRRRHGLKHMASAAFTSACTAAVRGPAAIPQIDGAGDGTAGSSQARGRERTSQRRPPAKSSASQSADRSQRYAALSVQLSQSAAEEDALSAPTAAASGDIQQH